MRRTRPAKLRRNPSASLVDNIPTTRTSGRETRSSRSASAPAIVRPPSTLWPPSSQSSPPGGTNASRAPAAIRDTQGGNRRPRIGELMAPEQAWRRQIEKSALVLIDQPAVFLAGDPFLAH